VVRDISMCCDCLPAKPEKSKGGLFLIAIRRDGSDSLARIAVRGQAGIDQSGRAGAIPGARIPSTILDPMLPATRYIPKCMYNVRSTGEMRFEWDEDKNRRNLAKHKVSFERASSVFDDPRSLSTQDCVVEGEERWQTVGMESGTVLLVAHTY
jgi:hypothetical protein